MKRKCKHKETSTERHKLPKGTEFEPEIYREVVFLRCLSCRKILDTKYY